jgi:hypothetical protein
MGYLFFPSIKHNRLRFDTFAGWGFGISSLCFSESRVSIKMREVQLIVSSVKVSISCDWMFPVLTNKYPRVRFGYALIQRNKVRAVSGTEPEWLSTKQAALFVQRIRIPPRR